MNDSTVRQWCGVMTRGRSNGDTTSANPDDLDRKFSHHPTPIHPDQHNRNFRLMLSRYPQLKVFALLPSDTEEIKILLMQ